MVVQHTAARTDRSSPVFLPKPAGQDMASNHLQASDENILPIYGFER
ncbi:MAG: hypothetical protein H6671_08795 [Anaerolineaceae bacterium]|nr:hypothetical protein [Anaerolineaceae bacterium]